ncbi:MAG: undecaprenyldiphospho-muramoylpentapeptide beta-N-acetylglucosaminyltransferase [Candidatus Omnitrophica bacterium]|nr:undecaprenyldiphospho-muramoylpentapeptide beta-N-acetylglucosaminyltransferase [Candidatus Omnitrophota bacterium]MDD5653060.1 undecaprenyldiphospho-muramoylpentapeptide beta-N-acetylglucosaminyltransferase [Candidatus Omnitrophota bacterium]
MKVLVVTGSSGGHIFPALGFLDTLKEKSKALEVFLLLPKKNLELHLENSGYQVQYLGVSSPSKKLSLENFAKLAHFLRASVLCAKILLRFNPDVVVGFGSLTSLPAVSLAWLMRISTVIHEQNVVPGRANRLLAYFADKTAISFPQTRDYLKISPKRIVLTGNPLRKEIFRVEKEEALRFFGFSRDKLTILIMGGSQASERINAAFLKAVIDIPQKNNLQVIHLAGKKDFSRLEEEYKKAGILARVFAFLEEMRYAYSAADLAVSRAGAVSISELIFFKLPGIIIPYPYAYQHQLKNARVLEKDNLAIIIEESKLDSGVLKNTMEALLSSPERLAEMRRSYEGKTMNHGNELLAEEVISLAAYEN